MKLSSIGGSTLYHGTSDRHLDSIFSDGIKPRESPGGDAWALANGWGNYGASFRDEGRDRSVFLTANEDHASLYAVRACKQVGGEPVVLKLEVPANVAMPADEAGGGRAFRYEGVIEPSWVVQVLDIDMENDALVPRKRLQ